MGDTGKRAKFRLHDAYECQCGAGFKTVTIVLPLKSWLKQPGWTHPEIKRTFYGILCKNDHFVEDVEAQWHVTESNRNGNRGRQYIRVC